MGLRAGSRTAGHHGEPVTGGFLHQDGHELPGRMGIEPVVHIPDDPPHDGGVDCGKVPRKSLCDMFNGVAFGIGNHPCQTDRPDRGPSIQQPVNRNARPVRPNHAPTPLSSPHRSGNGKYLPIRPVRVVRWIVARAGGRGKAVGEKLCRGDGCGVPGRPHLRGRCGETRAVRQTRGAGGGCRRPVTIGTAAASDHARTAR